MIIVPCGVGYVIEADGWKYAKEYDLWAVPSDNKLNKGQIK
jgi:hypothetical protein